MDIVKINVKCDENCCGWTKNVTITEILQWHNKLCPKCNKGIIVSDEDMEVFSILSLVEQIDNCIDPDKNLPRTDVKISTAPMRIGQPVSITQIKE